MSLERLTALLRLGGLDPDGDGSERRTGEEFDQRDYLPCQELGREESAV